MRKLEFLFVHLIAVVSVLLMSWAPLIYALRTVSMHRGAL